MKEAQGAQGIVFLQKYGFIRVSRSLEDILMSKNLTLADQPRRSVVTIKHPIFSTVLISGHFERRTEDGRILICNPCGAGYIKGEHVPLMVRK